MYDCKRGAKAGKLSYRGTAGQTAHCRSGEFHWRKVQNLH
jgi:hypothetical protein